MAPTLKALELSSSEWVAGPGDTQQAQAKLLWSDGRRTDAGTAVRWSVTAPQIVSVDAATGVMKALAPGQATVMATAVQHPALTASLQVTVRAAAPVPAVLGVEVQAPRTTLQVGESVQATAQVRTQGAASTGVNWTSSAPGVLSVDANGTLRALAAGQATVTATSVADPSQRGQLTLTVQAPLPPAPSPRVERVTVTPAAMALAVGQTQALTAQVEVSGGASQAVTWRSSDPAVATVDAAGRVTALKAGQAVITASSVADASKSASSTVTVSAPAPVPTVERVTVTPGTLALEVSQTQALTATVQVSGGASQAVEWRSSNPAVASVDSGGRVTALTVGQATVTATSAVDPSKSAAATVTVTAPFRILPGGQRLPRGMPGQLTLQGAGNAGVTWSSSDNGLLRINADGSFVTGSRAGQATVTATASDGRTATTTVTVLNQWLTSHQAWRSVTDTCTLALNLIPNTAAEIQASLSGECPNNVPMQVVHGDGTVFAQGQATPGQPFTFLFPAKRDARVYLQVFRNGTLNGEPAAVYYWSGTEF